jgi:hypothetical protein
MYKHVFYLYGSIQLNASEWNKSGATLVFQHSVYMSRKGRQCQAVHLVLSSCGSPLHSVVEPTVSLDPQDWLRFSSSIQAPEHQGQPDVLGRHFHAPDAKARTLVPRPSRPPLSVRNQSHPTVSCWCQEVDSEKMGRGHLRH